MTVTRVATELNATTFFSSRDVVADKLKLAMETTFRDQALCTALNFQLNGVSLPAPFESEIANTEVQKQDIRTAEAERFAKEVQGETQVKQAEQQYEAIILAAQASAETVRLNNDAYVEQFNITQRLQAEGFVAIYENLGSSEEQLLEYMRMRALRDHPAWNSIISIQK